MDYIVQTDGLTKRYRGEAVVKGLNLDIPAQSVYGFLGPNGAGKSTTMKMLLGLTRPTSGGIRILGREMDARNRIAILKETGSLIESPSYYGHLTGRENLELIAAMKQVEAEQVDEALDIVRLTDAQKKRAGRYSLGMKQRLGIAGALLGFPKLLLLDEPTNGLDPAGIQEIRRLIVSLPERYGMTVLVSSHLLSEIDQMATHVGIINLGELVYQGKLSELERSGRQSLEDIFLELTGGQGE